MSLSREQQILLQAYQEAGRICQSHDQLTRTGLSIFAAIQSALIAYIAKEGNSSVELLSLGLWLSVVVFITTLRLGWRHNFYMERAKQIEHRLGMSLYTYCQNQVERNEKVIPLQRWSKKFGGNKGLMQAFLY